MRSSEVTLICGTGSDLNRDIVFCTFYEAASSNLLWYRHCLPVRQAFGLVYGFSLSSRDLEIRLKRLNDNWTLSTTVELRLSENIAFRLDVFVRMRLRLG
jgi:hypothetical protein